MHSFHYNPFFERLEGRDGYQVCSKVINIGLNTEQALTTDPFGATGEELIQCIDAYSIEKSGYQALSLEVPEEDVEAREDFQLLGSPDFPQLIRLWEKRLAKTWLYSKWLLAIDARKKLTCSKPCAIGDLPTNELALDC